MFENSVEALNLRSFNFYKEEVNMEQDVYKRMVKNMVAIGGFQYQKKEISNVRKLRGTSDIGYDYVYVGEMKEGTTNIPHGRGIQVYSDGLIRQGTYVNKKLHGIGRRVRRFGDYSIGQYKFDKKHGYVTEKRKKSTFVWFYQNGKKVPLV